MNRQTVNVPVPKAQSTLAGIGWKEMTFKNLPLGGLIDDGH
jgi:hypothetical protein